jgi:hypothetical protein
MRPAATSTPRRPSRAHHGGRICAIARGLGSPSAVAVGRPVTAFAGLYAVTFGGDVIEIANP